MSSPAASLKKNRSSLASSGESADFELEAEMDFLQLNSLIQLTTRIKIPIIRSLLCSAEVDSLMTDNRRLVHGSVSMANFAQKGGRHG